MISTNRSPLYIGTLLFVVLAAILGLSLSNRFSSWAFGEPPAPASSKFASADAILVFNNSGNWSPGEKILIYDESGSVWYEAPFTKPDFQHSRDAGPNKIHPFTIENGDFTPEFRCTGISWNWYEVVVDEVASPKIKKFIKRGDWLFEFKSWSQYYVGREITFVYKKTDVFDSPNGEPLRITPAERPRIKALAMERDWLQISWAPGSYIAESEDSAGTDLENRGWIRWRDGEQVLVDTPRD